MTTKAMTHSRSSRARARTVKFGDITITAPAPAQALVERNVRMSTQALERVAKRLAKPGVIIRAKKNVPLYSLDSEDPDVMIRTLNGQTERGRMVNGVFDAIE